MFPYQTVSTRLCTDLCLFNGHLCLYFAHSRFALLARHSFFFLRFTALLSSFVVHHAHPLISGR